MRKFIIASIIIALFSFITGCDKGIEPEPEKVVAGPSGFSGKVTFTGNWPAGIKRTHLIVFKNPIVSSQDFSYSNLGFVIDSIPYRSTEFNINSIDQNYIAHNFLSSFNIVPGEYAYIIVAQSKTPEISFARSDWFIVGVYCIGNDQSKPGTMTIQEGVITTGIDINVDFNNPPPQPPGG